MKGLLIILFIIILGFARVVVGVVSCSMLVAYMRVQLSILGGVMFRDLHRPPGEELGAPPDIQKKFLSNVQYFLEDGMGEGEGGGEGGCVKEGGGCVTSP